MATRKTIRRSKPNRVKPVFGNRSSLKQLLPFIVIFAVIGTYLLFFTNASPGNRPVERFVDQPERGVVWAGLKANPNSALCGGNLLEVIGRDGNALACTHGPDPAPEGIDVRKPVEALSTGEESLTVGETTGIACDGDGTSGKRVQLIYARASDKPDRYAEFAASFQQWAGNINNIFMESAQATGEARGVRFVTNTNCQPVIERVVLSPAGDDNFSGSVYDVQQAGHSRSDRKYIMWVDNNIYCGIAQFISDDRSGTNNANNGGPSYSRIDSGCWGLNSSVETHELIHNLGGVQFSAPHTTGGGHCTDEYDRLCYTDSREVTMTYPCPLSFERLLDCNKDDYFYAGTPPAGNYLATHWNIATSVFLINGGGTTTPPPPSSDTTLPLVTVTAPADGAIVKRQTPITASATDNVGVVKMEVYIDGALKASSTSGSISTNWNANKASRGTHTITVKAYDASGNVGQSSITVTKN